MLLEILIRLISEVQAGKAPRTGICAYVGDNGTKEDEHQLIDLFPLWPGYSGTWCCPIPCPDGGTPARAWVNIPQCFRYDVTHPYGKSRMEFLHWAVEHLTTEA